MPVQQSEVKSSTLALRAWTSLARAASQLARATQSERRKRAGERATEVTLLTHSVFKVFRPP